MSRTHTSDDVDPAAIRDAKTYLRLRAIPKLSQARANFPYFSLAEARPDLEGNQKGVEPESLNRYLHELTKEGVIFNAGRGWYSTLQEPFNLDRTPVQGLVELLERRFPFLEFSCWSTAQIAGYSHHHLARFTHFVHLDRDAMESVADALRESGRTAHIDPEKSEIGKNLQLTDGVVVVRPAVSRAPVAGKYATIEKILVDVLVEAADLNLIDEAEHRRIVENALSRRRISIAAMLSYAQRRGIPERRLIRNEPN
jgi:hypothetical protein